MLITLLAILMNTVASPLPHDPQPYALHRAAPAISDAEIFGTLSILDAAMIEAAKLGTSKASTQDVRDYATSMQSAHERSKREGDSLAARRGITPAIPADKDMANEHIRAMARLKRLSGGAFDREFVRSMVDGHEKAIRTVTDKLLNKASDADLKAFMLRWQPAQQKHVDMGREWLRRHRTSR